MPDQYAPAATRPDAPRPVATSPDQYTLTIEDALLRYEHAGHPRTTRSIQRYCAKGHLDSLRQETMFGDKFMITPESVARHISQIDELASASGRDMARQVAIEINPRRHDLKNENRGRQEASIPEDMARHDATSRDMSEPVADASTKREVPPQALADPRYIEQLEIRLAEKDDVITMLRSEADTKNRQIVSRDQQIAAMLDRDKEVNILMQGYQRLLGLLPQAKTQAQPRNEEMQTDQPSGP